MALGARTRSERVDVLAHGCENAERAAPSRSPRVGVPVAASPYDGGVTSPIAANDPVISGRAIAGSVIGGAALAGGVLLAGSVGWVRRLSAGRLHSVATVPEAPVAIVLGALVYPSGRPSAFLAARLDVGARLLAAGKVRCLLVSGDNMAREYNEPEAMRRYLIERGVPEKLIICDYAGFDTYDTAYRARDVFGASRVIMVSQTYHLARAVATARALGLEAYGVGDQTVRSSTRWRRGELRDQIACLKTIWDLATRRRPVLGPVEQTMINSDAPATS